MRLYCDNQTAIHKAKNSVFHGHTEHIEVDCYLLHQKIEDKIVQARHVLSVMRLTYLFTKYLENTQVDFICGKLNMYDIYTPT